MPSCTAHTKTIADENVARGPSAPCNWLQELAQGVRVRLLEINSVRTSLAYVFVSACSLTPMEDNGAYMRTTCVAARGSSAMCCVSLVTARPSTLSSGPLRPTGCAPRLVPVHLCSSLMSSSRGPVRALPPAVAAQLQAQRRAQSTGGREMSGPERHLSTDAVLTMVEHSKCAGEMPAQQEHRARPGNLTRTRVRLYIHAPPPRWGWQTACPAGQCGHSK